jgi:glycosyltransferase involved in cell wall biosynthesis
MSTLSFITINYNNLPGLQKTLTSVWGQRNKNFEFVIIDGGSTDGSRELIENNSTKLTYWVSEKDNGIYNAMNKGIVKATGEYLFFKFYLLFNIYNCLNLN